MNEKDGGESQYEQGTKNKMECIESRVCDGCGHFRDVLIFSMGAGIQYGGKMATDPFFTGLGETEKMSATRD